MLKLTICLFVLLGGLAQAREPNWTGQYPPCDRHIDLWNRGHVDLGVRIASANANLARQFAQAMDFWAGVLDLAWHPDDSRACSIGLVDGTPGLFATAMAARSQLPDRAGFQGWIAFNPGARLTEKEMFIVSVHEIGHLLGLPHNPSASSVMFFLPSGDSVSLTRGDMDLLARRHKLREGIAETVAIAAN